MVSPLLKPHESTMKPDNDDGSTRSETLLFAELRTPKPRAEPPRKRAANPWNQRQRANRLAHLIGQLPTVGDASEYIVAWAHDCWICGAPHLGTCDICDTCMALAVRIGEGEGAAYTALLARYTISAVA